VRRVTIDINCLPAIRATRDAFEEEKHPRGEGGRFGPGTHERGVKTHELHSDKQYKIISVNKGGQLSKSTQHTPGLTSHLEPEHAVSRLEEMHRLNPGKSFILAEHEGSGGNRAQEHAAKRIDRYLKQKWIGPRRR
jgi:hypothetical protein